MQSKRKCVRIANSPAESQVIRLPADIQHSINLKLQFSIIDILRQYKINESCHFYANNAAGERLTLTGKHLEDDYFSLRIMGCQDFTKSLPHLECHVLDATLMSSGNTWQDSTAQSICDTSSGADFTKQSTPFQGSISTSNAHVKNNPSPRTSSRLCQKYGGRPSVVKKLAISDELSHKKGIKNEMSTKNSSAIQESPSENVESLNFLQQIRDDIDIATFKDFCGEEMKNEPCSDLEWSKQTTDTSRDQQQPQTESFQVKDEVKPFLPEQDHEPSSDEDTANEHEVNKCKLCSYSTMTKRAFKTHLTTVHWVTLSEYNKTDTEDLMKVDKSAILRELRTTKSSETHKESEIMQTGKLSRQEWNSLKASHTFSCQLCGYTAQKRNNFRKHLLKQHSMKINDYRLKYNLDPLDLTSHCTYLVCHLCKFDTPSVIQLWRHVHENHQMTKADYMAKFDVGEDGHTVTEQPMESSQDLTEDNKQCTLISESNVLPKAEPETIQSIDMIDQKTKLQNVPESKVKQKSVINNLMMMAISDEPQDESPVIPSVPSSADIPSDNQSKLYMCELCRSYYGSTQHLIRHLNRQHAKDPQSSRCILAVKDHEYFLTPGKYYINCVVCKTSYPGSRILAHMRLTHKNLAAFQETFELTKKMLYKERYKTIQESHLAKTECPKCKKSVKQCALRRHLKNHCKMNKDVQKRYDCHLCSYFSYDQEDCLNHKRTVHEDRSLFICHICAKPFQTVSGLTEHARIKHDIAQKKTFKYKYCPECGKATVSKSMLDRHMLTHQKRDQLASLHQCTVCSKEFREKANLSKHMRNIHRASQQKQAAIDMESQQSLEKPSQITTGETAKKRISKPRKKPEKVTAVAEDIPAENDTTVEAATVTVDSNTASILMVTDPEQQDNLDSSNTYISLIRENVSLNAEADGNIYVIMNSEDMADSQSTLISLTGIDEGDQPEIYNVMKAASDAADYM